MCWIGKNKPKVAGENTVVFKIAMLEVDGVRPYYRRDSPIFYEKDKEYTSPIKKGTEVLFPNDDVDIQDGLHCFSLFRLKISDYCFQYGLGEILTIGPIRLDIQPKTFSFMNSASKYNRLKYMLCQIPEGTIYYENDYGEIVAEKLKVLDIEDLSTVWTREKLLREQLTREKLLREQLLTNQII